MSQSTVNEKLKGWDEAYWHDQFIDASDGTDVTDARKKNIPDFLK